MSSRWPKVELAEVLTQKWRFEENDPAKEYLLIGAHWYAGGLYIKNRKFGREIQANKLYQIRAGDFVYNRLFAWKGSFALADANVDGCYVSNEFPVFEINNKRLEGRFIYWNFKREKTWTESLGMSVGATPTSRNRLKEALFLKMLIPLPPLADQRRIVTRIEELAAQINEARTLRQQAVEEVEALISSSSESCFQPKKGWKTMAVGEFCEPPQYGYTESATPDPIGPRFLRITDIQGGRVDWKRVPFCKCPDPEKYLLKPGDLVFARTGATTGKSFVIKKCPEAVFASYLIRLRVRDMVSVDYLYHYFQSPSYWIQIADEKKGTGQPNLNGAKLEKLKVPVAPGPEQRRIVAELDALETQVDSLKRLQAETAAEIDALLPSILDRAFKGEI